MLPNPQKTVSSMFINLSFVKSIPLTLKHAVIFDFDFLFPQTYLVKMTHLYN